MSGLNLAFLTSIQEAHPLKQGLKLYSFRLTRISKG